MDDILTAYVDLLPLPASVPPPPKSPPLPTHRTAVIFQEACAGHRYTRSNDLSTIVERPERLRAIKLGVATAWSRLENRNIAQGQQKWIQPQPQPLPVAEEPTVETDLEKLMQGLGIKDTTTVAKTGGRPKRKAGGGEVQSIQGGPFDVLFSTRSLPVNDPALLYVHPLPNLPPSDDPNKLIFNTTPWPSQLQALCRNSGKAQQTLPSKSEIPTHLPQGDLYLSEESEGAISGALGAVCEAVDRVVDGARGDGAGGTGIDRAFVAVRPPGHHCGETDPMGFCFVNNVAVGAAHAYQQHGVDRIVILDIDLHHGNGTQEIVWRINALADETNRRIASAAASSPRKSSPSKTNLPPPPLSILYASLHDVNSYPCEDGDTNLIQGASINLMGGHSQWISNCHLESWKRESEFHEKLYPKYREGLLGAAAEFCEKNAGEVGKTMLFISAGFDASEHESAGMSRHRRNVPTSFYHRFARDAIKFATTYCGGKVVAVLEGGYSDRALSSSSLAFLVGLVEAPRISERTFLVEDGDELSWWDVGQLVKIEKACKSSPSRKTGGRDHEPWLARTVEIFGIIDGSGNNGDKEKKANTGTVFPAMQLRERKPRNVGGISQDSTPCPSPTKRSAAVRNSAPLPPQTDFLSQAQLPLSNDPSTPFPSLLPTFATPPKPTPNGIIYPPLPPSPLSPPKTEPYIPSFAASSPLTNAQTTPPNPTPPELKVKEEEVKSGLEDIQPPKIKITWRAGGI